MRSPIFPGRSAFVVTGMLLAATACSSESRKARHAGDGGADQVVDRPGACTVETLAEFPGAETYYVAAEEPGANDDACDGLSPSNEGAGRCPFLTLNGARIRAILAGSPAGGVRVELRTGRYVVAGWDGLNVNGSGATESEPVVLTSRAGETAILDVGSPDGAGCTATTTPPTNPDCVRQVVRLTGQYVVVQGLTIQNGLAYDLEVQGAHQHVRCNAFRYPVDFAQRSDCLKISGQTSDVHVELNTFTEWHSQAIDITQATSVFVERNEFFEPHDQDGGATGTKFGARDVTIRDNDVHDLGTDPRTHAFALGGTGSPHPDTFEAFGVHVVGNRVRNVTGILAEITSCETCSVENNDVSDLGAGILLSAAARGLPECSTSVSGCLASAGTRIAGNRLRALDGNGDPASANVFVAVEPGEGGGLVGESNIYCAASASTHRFGLGGAFVSFTDWVSATGTDGSSLALADGDARCSF